MMTIYCYRCNLCGFRTEHDFPFGCAPRCLECQICPDGFLVRDFRAESKTLRVPFFFQNTQSDFLPREVIGASKVSKEFRKYANETQGKREL